MWDEADVVVFDQVSDAPGGSQTAAAREIGLNDVHLAPFDQVAKSPVGRLLLARSNGRFNRLGQPCVTVVILGGQAILHEEWTEGLDTSDHPNALFGRAFYHPAWIDQEVPVRPQSVPGRSHELHIELRVLPENAPPEFHSGESLLDIALAGFGHGFRRRSKQGAGVSAHAVATMRSKKLVNRLPDDLPNDAPQAIVDARQRLDGHAPAAVVHTGLVHLVPELFDLEGVFPDEGLAESVDHPGSSRRRVDHGFGDVGLSFHVRVGRDSIIGGYLDDQHVANPVRLLRTFRSGILPGRLQNHSLDIFYLHRRRAPQRWRPLRGLEFRL